jgi:hypothetical protein
MSVEEGEYIGKCIAIDEEIAVILDKKTMEKKQVEMFKFTFEIVNGEQKGKLIPGKCSKYLSLNSKLGIWLSEGYGIKKINEGVELNDIIGRIAKIYVENTTSKAGVVYSNVTKVKYYNAPPEPTQNKDISIKEDDISSEESSVIPF